MRADRNRATRYTAGVLSLALASASTLWLVGAESALAEPEIESANPADGAVIAEPPGELSLCFTEPVVTEGGDPWTFTVRPPGGQVLGLNVVFETAGDCVRVLPGVAQQTEGIWAFDWRVTAQSDASENSGTVRFQVGQLQPNETPLAPTVVDSDDDDEIPIVPVVVAAAGILVVIAGAAGFVLTRRKA